MDRTRRRLAALLCVAAAALVVLLVPGLWSADLGEEGAPEPQDATSAAGSSGVPTLAGAGRGGSAAAESGARAAFEVRDAVTQAPCPAAEFYAGSMGAAGAAPVDEATVLAYWNDGEALRLVRGDVIASELEEGGRRERIAAEQRPDATWIVEVAAAHRSLGVRCPGYAPRLVPVPPPGTTGMVRLHPARVLQGSVTFPTGAPDPHTGRLAAVGTNGEGAWSVVPAAGGEFSVEVGAERVVLACRSEAWVLQEPVRTYAPAVDRASIVLIHNPAVRATTSSSGESRVVARAILVDSVDRQRAIVLGSSSGDGPPRLFGQPGSQQALGRMRAPVLIVFTPEGHTGTVPLEAAARAGAVPEIVVEVSVGRGRPGLVLGGAGASVAVLNVARRPVGSWARSTLEVVRKVPVGGSGQFEILLEPGHFLLWADAGPVLPLDHRGADGGDTEILYRVDDVGDVLAEAKPPEDGRGESWAIVARCPFTGEQIRKESAPGAVTEFRGLTAAPWHFALAEVDELPHDPGTRAPSHPSSRVLVRAGTTQTVSVGTSPPTGPDRRRLLLGPEVRGLSDSMRIRALTDAEQTWVDVPSSGQLDVLLLGSRELELEGRKGERWRIVLGDGERGEAGSQDVDLGEGRYFGTVRTRHGHPVPRARVAFIPLRNTGLGLTMATVRADESGLYRARGLIAGERYMLSFSKEEHTSLGQFLPSTPPSAEGVQVDLSEVPAPEAADTVELEIEFRGHDRHPNSSVRWSVLSTATTSRGTSILADSEARFLRAGAPVETVRVARGSGYLVWILFVRDALAAHSERENLWIPLSGAQGRNVVQLP